MSSEGAGWREGGRREKEEGGRREKEEGGEEWLFLQQASLTKIVQDVSDEYKFTWVELYDCNVYQQLGALQEGGGGRERERTATYPHPHNIPAPHLDGYLESLHSLVVVPTVDQVLVEVFYLPQVLLLVQIECLLHRALLQVVQLLQTTLHLVH